MDLGRSKCRRLVYGNLGSELGLACDGREVRGVWVVGRGSGANGWGVGLRWFGGWFVGAWGRIIVVEQIRGVWLWVVVGWTVSRRVGFADRACTRREARGRIGLSRCARGGVVFASNARFGSIR